MKEFLKQALSSGSDASSKRIITFMIGVALVLSLFIAQLFKLLPPDWMYDNLSSVLMFGLGAIASEVVGKFTKKQ